MKGVNHPLHASRALLQAAPPAAGRSRIHGAGLGRRGLAFGGC